MTTENKINIGGHGPPKVVFSEEELRRQLLIDEAEEARRIEAEDADALEEEVGALVEDEVEPVERVNPLITSRELYRIDREWEKWSESFSRTGEIPEAPVEEDLLPFFENFQKAVADLQTSRQEARLEEPTPIAPNVPDVDPTELSDLYGLTTNAFVKSRQLADMALPPDQRSMIWEIPYEQYLTWEQARYLGFDVPEGSVVKMTPMVDGETSFTLLPSPEAAKAEPSEELLMRLRDAFPFMFDPANSYGFSEEEIPNMVVDTLQRRMQSDFGGFVTELNARLGEYEAENVLRMMGVTEEHILAGMDFDQQDRRVNGLVTDVFPDFKDAVALTSLLENDFELFIETMQTGGGSTEKRKLLELIGYKPEEINQIFSRQRLEIDIDGASRQVIVDVENQAAYDAQGNYVGAYNPATKQFTKAKQESILKDVWDWTTFQSRTMWEQGENFFLSVMPNLIYQDVPLERDKQSPFERLLSDDAVKFLNETNRQQREHFRWLYGQNKEEYNKWVRANPELLAPVEYQEGMFQHPELWKDPRYYAYELANIVPFIVTATGVALLTGGVGLPAVIGTAALMTPIEGQAVYEDLINAGAPENEAAKMAAVSGGLIGLLESAGRIPMLKQVSPFLFGQFKKKAISELSKQGLLRTVAKFGRNFTINQFSEVSTEVMQEVVGNVAVSFYDENRGVLDNLPDIAVKTAVATLLPAGGAAAVSVRMISRNEQLGLTDLTKKAKGWIKDEKGNWFTALRGERGSIILPGDEEITPTEGAGEVVSKEMRDYWDKKLENNPLRAGIKDTDAGAFVSKKIENAGDILRELANPSPDNLYITEKITAIRRELQSPDWSDELSVGEMDNLVKTQKLVNKLPEQGDLEGSIWRLIKSITQRDTKAILSSLDNVEKLIGEVTLPQQALVEQRAQQEGISISEASRKIAEEQIAAAEALPVTPEELARQEPGAPETGIQPPLIEDVPTQEMIETPIEAVTETTMAEVVESSKIVPRPKYNLKQIDALNGFFADYLNDPNTMTAWQLTRELRRETLTARAESLKARTQELMVEEGITSEEAMKQAIGETMRGELPAITTDFLEGVTEDLRDSLFSKVSRVLKDEPFEMMSTFTALTNALRGRPIPRVPGVRGGSAYARLQRVFNDKPKVFKAIEKLAEEKKPLEDIVEAVFHETGRNPIPVDQETADYLRNLTEPPPPLGEPTRTMLPHEPSDLIVKDLRDPAELQFAMADVALQSQLAKGEITFSQFELRRATARDKAFPIPPITHYEAPIEEAIKEIPFWPVPVRDNVIKALKDLGWVPIDIGNFLRANKASFDFSFWRQQAPLIASHPITFAQANVAAWNAIFSQKSAEASWQKITQDPLYHIYEFAAEEGGDFLRPLILPKGSAQWRGTEEFGYLTGERAIPRFTAKLPHVKVSARAFETGTNEHNWLIFKNYYSAMLRYSEDIASGKKKLKPGEVFNMQKEMIDFAKSLANFTARGSLGRQQTSAAFWSGLFFAPRASIGRLLSVKDLINANPRVRAEAWKNAASFVSIFGGIVLLGAAAGWWEVEKDPRSAEYMSIRIGNTRIDPWGGFRQFLVFFTRMFTTVFTDKPGGISSVTGAAYDPDALGLIQNLLVGKASPLLSTMLDFVRGRNFVGEKVEIDNLRQWIERVAPFAPWDIYEAFLDDPIHAVWSAIPAVLGAGVQTYTGDWKENFPRLGLPKYDDNLHYGITEPFYTTEDLWADTASQFGGVDPATLLETKGFPEYIRAIAEARAIKDDLAIMPNEKLADMEDFGKYHAQWLKREELVAEGDEQALKEFDQDERTKSAYKGNFSQRQFSLLMEYHSITDEVEKAEFLEKHEADIGVNPRQDWLRSHPKENAELAVWGQAKLLSRAAFDEFNSLIKSLDIPDNALPANTLPPEASVDNYFERQDAIGNYGAASAEAMVVLARDPDLLKWFQDEAVKAGEKPLQDPKQPERYYELQAKNRAEREHMATLADKDASTYIDDPDERRIAFEREFPDSEYFDDNARIEAIANDFDDAEIEAWVERSRLVDEYSGGSPKVKEWAFDNPEAYEKAIEEGILKDKGGLSTPEERGHYEEWVEPAIRLQAKNIKEDSHWKMLGDKGSPETYIEDDAERRAAFFKQYPDSVYFDDLERIEAYKGGFTDTEADLWAARGRLLGKHEPQSAEAKIWLVDHPGVWEKAQTAGMITDDGSDWNIPALRITAHWRAQDDEYDAIPADTKEGVVARSAYLNGEGLEGDALARRIEYRKDRRRREAYEMKNSLTGETFPPDQVETFVGYHEIGAKGKRQERFLVENGGMEPDNLTGFAKAMHDVGGIDIPRPEDMPAVEFDDIYDEWSEDFTRLEGLSDNESPHYIDNPTERAKERDAMRFDDSGKYTEFGLAEIRRNGYGKFVPEEQVNNYVGYYKIIGEGKPKNWSFNTGTELWYEDDWFMMEHMDFYREVYRGLLGNEAMDFRKVPTRAVFNDYLNYLALPHLAAKDDFRAENLELDAWLVLKFGYTPIAEKKRRAGLTTRERFIEGFEERGAAIRERLKELRGE